jgi:hypothetical protein
VLTLRNILAAAALCAIVAPSVAMASGMKSAAKHPMSSGSMITMQPSRFSGPGVYTGPPALPVTLSMIIAGGGPAHFDSVTLVKVLAGKNFNAEVAKLTKQYGKTKVGNFLTVFNFVVADSLKIVTAAKVKLPSKPNPDPKNGKALSAALWNAGVLPNGGWSVEVMLDRAVSHPVHVQVMKDIDAKYGIGKDADYHAILTTAMHDLKAAYML